MFYAPAVHARRGRDHYSTPHRLTQALVSGLKQAGIELPSPVYDQCAGAGKLVESLTNMGFPAYGSDLYPEEYGQGWPRVDNRKTDARDGAALAVKLAHNYAHSLVTNPPYGRIAQSIVQTGVDLVRTGNAELCAFLLPLPWETAGNDDRIKLVRNAAARIVCCWRPDWIAGTNGGGKMNYVWWVWTRQPRLEITSIYVQKP